MNYIEQINVFWKLDAEHSFNGNESRLYFYLLNLSNSLFWKNPMTNADGYTASVVGISVNTLKTVRNRLQQAGLITFKPGGNGARNKCQYWIVPAAQVIRDYSNKVSMVDTLSAKTLTPYLIPSLGKVDDINKHKLNETKQGIAPAEPSPNENRLVKKEKPIKKKNEDPPEPYWEKLVEVWFKFFEEKFSERPSFQRDDPRILKRIVDRLKKRAADKKVEWTEENAISRFGNFLNNAWKEEWLRQNFLLNNLEKQFDKIITVLNERKNGYQQSTNWQSNTHRAVITGTAATAGTI